MKNRQKKLVEICFYIRANKRASFKSINIIHFNNNDNCINPVLIIDAELHNYIYSICMLSSNLPSVIVKENVSRKASNSLSLFIIIIIIIRKCILKLMYRKKFLIAVLCSFNYLYKIFLETSAFNWLKWALPV